MHLYLSPAMFTPSRFIIDKTISRKIIVLKTDLNPIEKSL